MRYTSITTVNGSCVQIILFIFIHPIAINSIHSIYPLLFTHCYSLIGILFINSLLLTHCCYSSIAIISLLFSLITHCSSLCLFIHALFFSLFTLLLSTLFTCIASRVLVLFIHLTLFTYCYSLIVIHSVLFPSFSHCYSLYSLYCYPLFTCIATCVLFTSFYSP